MWCLTIFFVMLLINNAVSTEDTNPSQEPQQKTIEQLRKNIKHSTHIVHPSTNGLIPKDVSNEKLKNNVLTSQQELEDSAYNVGYSVSKYIGKNIFENITSLLPDILISKLNDGLKSGKKAATTRCLKCQSEEHKTDFLKSITSTMTLDLKIIFKIAFNLGCKIGNAIDIPQIVADIQSSCTETKEESAFFSMAFAAGASFATSEEKTVAQGSPISSIGDNENESDTYEDFGILDKVVNYFSE